MSASLPEMLRRAKEHLEAAKRLLSEGLYAPAASRAYYSLFASMVSACGPPRRGRWRHGSLRQEFSKVLRKWGVKGKEAREILEGISIARSLREEADYGSSPIDREDVEGAVGLAERVLALVKHHLEERG